QMVICASKSLNGPPIAIYGLKTALTCSLPTVPASDLCLPTTSSCALISTGNSQKSKLTVLGTTYVPRSLIQIQMNNRSSKGFSWGVIAWAVTIGSTGSADLSQPI